MRVGEGVGARVPSTTLGISARGSDAAQTPQLRLRVSLPAGETRSAQGGIGFLLRAVAMLVTVVLFATAGFGQAARAAGRKSAGEPPARKPSVILITIDTTRADHVGCYGARDVKTPTLDSLAHDGVVFERAISQVPLTWPSHAVILTGTYPFQNGVQDFTGQPLGAQFRSVAQAFQKAGYATGAVVSAFVLDRSWGLARGFDFYDDAFSAKTFQIKETGLVDRRARRERGACDCVVEKDTGGGQECPPHTETVFSLAASLRPT